MNGSVSIDFPEIFLKNFIIFCPINKPKIPVTILINKEAIDETKHVKYLGILIDSQLTFKQHVGELNLKNCKSYWDTL